VRTNNAQSLRIEPSGELFNGLPITSNTIAGSSANFVTAGVRGATIAGGGVPAGNSDPFFSFENPNRVTDHYGTVGGGYNNQAGDADGTPADRPFATVGGGLRNTASGPVSTVGGGSGNTASGSTSTVGGGASNTASGPVSTVGGGRENNAVGEASTVGGGAGNTASGLASTVSGGDTNTASGRASTVGGGRLNNAVGDDSTVGGGGVNTASGVRSTVGGGAGNTASGFHSTVGGGEGNTASGGASTVGGGANNTASGALSTVSGGQNNCAGGFWSWAGGRRAKVRPAAAGSGACSGVGVGGTNGDQGTFVWADSQDANFVSTGNNQFLVRAQGGMAINTNTPEPGAALTVDGNVRVSGALVAQIILSTSDRAAKTAFAPVDVGRILAAVLQLPITSWSYRNEPTARHLGPVAQDFYQAFGLGDNDRTISTVDANGVALAAIQGLNAKLEAERDAVLTKLEAENAALRAESAELRAESAELRAESAELRARLQRLEALVMGRGSDKER
jgi:Skp family chaperone for outer membrane proteins